MFRSAKIPVFLALTYVFFLPFIKVGLGVSYFVFSVADISIVLAGVFLAIRYLRYRDLRINSEYRQLLFVQALFMFFLLPSMLTNPFKINFLLELLPFAQAFIVSSCFLALFSEERIINKGLILKSYLASFFISMIPMLIGMFLNTMQTSWLKVFFNDGQKYQFLCKSPNQYTFFVLVAIMFTVLNEDFPFILQLIIVMFGGAAVLLSGSRSGAVIFFIISLYIVLNLLIRVLKGKIKKMNILLFVSLGAVFSFMVIPFLAQRFWNTGRSLSGLQYILKGQYGDAYRQEQFKQAWELFKGHPWTGIGLGNFLRVSPDGHEIHNSFLSILTEAGIFGFMGLLFLQFFLFWTVARSSKRSLMRINGLVILGVCLLSMIPHHILRERWLWLLYIVIFVYFSQSGIKKNNTCAE
jgi:O-antigen ligase